MHRAIRFDEDRYNFQRLGNPENGRLRDGAREGGLGGRLDDSNINIPPDRFRAVKAKRAFVNDRVASLYLATHLWTKTFPTFVGKRATPTPVRINTTAQALADKIQSQFGPVRLRDIDAAMELLSKAGMAEQTGAREWTIAWGELQRRGSEVEIARLLAIRICAPSPRPGLLARLRRIERRGELLEPPLRLFEP